MTIKAVFFDWFDTLAQYDPPREHIQARACREAGIEIAEEAISPGLVLADHYYLEENLKSPVKQRSPMEQVEVYFQMERLVLARAGITTVSDDTLKEIMSGIGRGYSATSFCLFPDVTPTLKGLKEKGMVLGIISNIDQDLRTPCENLGISSYLDMIVTSLEIGAAKPLPPIYLAALERTGMQADQAMYVGDHHDTDVLGAFNVGIQGVLIDRHNSFPHFNDCLRIDRLDKLLDCV